MDILYRIQPRAFKTALLCQAGILKNKTKQKMLHNLGSMHVVSVLSDSETMCQVQTVAMLPKLTSL